MVIVGVQKAAATSAFKLWKTMMFFTSQAPQSPRLTRFTLQSPEMVELEFSDGRRFQLSAEFLRVQSPAADSKIRTMDGEKVISGRRHVGIMSAEPVGNYGIRHIHMGFLLSSGHQQIYPDEELYQNLKEA